MSEKCRPKGSGTDRGYTNQAFKTAESLTRSVVGAPPGLAPAALRPGDVERTFPEEEERWRN